MVSFRGTTAPAWALDGVRRGEIASFCLFAYNIESPAQLRELALSLHQAAAAGGHPPPLIGIDQEGGQLMAVTGGATELPGNMALGATRRADLAEAAGRVLGSELLAMGCTMDFAPVLDLALRPENPVIGIRAFGDDPELVAQLGAALIRGIQSTGMVATAKHFPGHGDTSVDPHHAGMEIPHTRERLDAVELVPFRAAIAAGVGAVMSTHATFPGLDSVAATLSKRVLGDLLRDDLGFDGLIVTDAMDMSAVGHLSPLQRAGDAVAAGNDLVLLGHLEDQAQLVSGLESRFSAPALARIDLARRALPVQLPSLDVVGSTEHRQVAQEIADAAITVVRSGNLPLRPEPEDEIAVVTVRAGDLTPADTSSAVRIRFADQVTARHPRTVALDLPYRASSEQVSDLVAAVRNAAMVVVGTVDAAQDASQAAFLRALRQAGHDPVVVALRTPFDLNAAPWLTTYLCAYGIREPNTESAVRVLFGEIEAEGRLPCRMPTAREATPATGVHSSERVEGRS